MQQDLFIGTMLGDGNLETNNGQTWRYRAIHKSLHHPYLEHKYYVLKNFCTSESYYSEILDKRTNRTYKRFSFNTVFTDAFRFYGQKFYVKEKNIWKKHVPVDIKKFLTPRALAYWYMDDGALKWKGRSNAVRFCTDSFSKYEVERLGEALVENFGFKISYQKKGDILRIAVGEESYLKLRSVMIDHLHHSMYYKFPDGKNGVLSSTMSKEF